MDKSTLIAQYRQEHPTIKIGSDETGYTILNETEYEQTLSDWADNAIKADIAKQQETATAQAKETAKASAIAKLTALGLTQDEVTALIGA
jgi:hypothetical protein